MMAFRPAEFHPTAISASRVLQATPSPRSREVLRSAGAGVAGFSGLCEERPMPASPSMHETSLYQKDKWTEPKMESVNLAREALERDAHEQIRKYGCCKPTAGSARFNVVLPQGPQHSKFSWDPARIKSMPNSPRVVQATAATISNHADSASDPGDSGTSPSDAKPKFEQGFKFNVATLRRWFKEIDTDSTGEVSRKELLVALRKQRELQRMMISKMGAADLPAEAVLDVSKLSFGEEIRVAQREENQRIKRIMGEVDTDGSGTMEWPEFVDFFRRAGMLLEYRTKSILNRTGFAPQSQTVAKEIRAQQKEELEKLMIVCDVGDEKELNEEQIS